jgi:hypothetical protein
MKIARVSAPYEEVFNKDNCIDYAIFASGYESRARHVAQTLEKAGVFIRQSTCIGFYEHKDKNKAREMNDEYYDSHNIEVRTQSGKETTEIEKLLKEITTHDEDTILLIDITSMTRSWYGGIVRIIREYRSSVRLRTIFTYAPAHPPGDFRQYPPNTIVEPIRGFASLRADNDPLALVVSLGCEHGRAMALHEQVDPKKTIAVIANPSLYDKYVEVARKSNLTLLERLKDSDILQLPVRDTFASLITLNSYISGIVDEYTVIYASLGPKIFGLYGMLLSTAYDNMSVWRVSPGAMNLDPFDHRPAGPILLLDVEWYDQ